jgi:hypothetical protein
LLLIGESHYWQKGSTQNPSAETWYAGNSSTLSQEDIGWLNTAELFRDAREEGFSNKAHSIWKNALWEINEYGPRYTDYTCVADDIAFYNFFLRPAIHGDSLAVTPQDVQLANEAFVVHFESLKPSAVVFLSTLARNRFHAPTTCSVPVVSTPHPGCQWWNHVARKYGNRRGRDILADFVRSFDWPQSAIPA